MRRLPCVPRDRRRPLRRLRRNGCREQSRRRRNGRAARARGVRAGRCALQGLHDRRSAHADEPRVQRDAEDARGAAAACEVHPRDHRSAEDSRHGVVALPAVQPEADAGRAHRVASRAHSRRRAHRVRAAGAASARACGAGQHARRAVVDRPGDRLFGQRSDRSGGVGHARRARPDLHGAAARCARGRQRPRDSRDRRRNVAAQPVVLDRAAGSREPAAPDRVGAVRAGLGARRMAGSGRSASLRRAAEPRTGAAVLSDRDGRPRGTRPRARRIRGFHDDAAAHARVRAGRRCRQRAGRSAVRAARRTGAACGCRGGSACGEAGVGCPPASCCSGCACCAPGSGCAGTDRRRRHAAGHASRACAASHAGFARREGSGRRRDATTRRERSIGRGDRSGRHAGGRSCRTRTVCRRAAQHRSRSVGRRAAQQRAETARRRAASARARSIRCRATQ
ncbi:hypothetical protein IST4119_01573 [Burkholderia multivorans]|nr:hypothetical protein IST4119_01573 [Burkholderia multivorans]